jgi:hypothetical protein
MKALYIVLMALLLAGCGTSPEDLTSTVVMAQAQTQTAAPSLTPTFTLTSTSQPTPTSTSTPTPKPTNSPQPTPASVGEIIEFGSLEITLLHVETHSHIVPGGFYYYYAKQGYIFVELGVLVRNTGSAPVTMRMKNIYIVDENNDKWFASFGTFKTVEVDKRFNPISIHLTDIVNTGEENISFEKDTYLRLIFSLKDHQSLLFGIQNSPQFAFDVNKK